MNHKRRRPKNRRRGCLMCKFWKMNGAKKGGGGWRRWQQMKADSSFREQTS